MGDRLGIQVAVDILQRFAFCGQQTDWLTESEPIDQAGGDQVDIPGEVKAEDGLFLKQLWSWASFQPAGSNFFPPGISEYPQHISCWMISFFEWAFFSPE